MIGRAITGILAGTTPDKELVYSVELAVCEAVANSIKHAHACRADCSVEVNVLLYPSDIVVQVTDTGIPLNTEILKQKQQLCEPRDNISETEGGRGLFLIQKTMDEVRYKSFAGKNTLTMKKKIPSGRLGA